MTWHFSTWMQINDEEVDVDIVFAHNSDSGFYPIEVMMTYENGISEQLNLKLTSKELDKQIQDKIEDYVWNSRNNLKDDYEY